MVSSTLQSSCYQISKPRFAFSRTTVVRSLPVHIWYYLYDQASALDRRILRQAASSSDPPASPEDSDDGSSVDCEFLLESLICTPRTDQAKRSTLLHSGFLRERIVLRRPFLNCIVRGQAIGILASICQTSAMSVLKCVLGE